MSRASSSVGAAAGSPSRVRDGGVLGPGDLRKGEDAAPGRGEARGGHRERGGSPGPGLPVWAGLRACSAVTVSLLSSLKGQHRSSLSAVGRERECFLDQDILSSFLKR